ncbi:MAG: Lrp/AsnC family transcriptional regulator, partial [Candidatus Bathyarchaeia archaeon]
MARGTTVRVDIDTLDLSILAELIENSRASFKELSGRLSIHPNVIAYRVKRLEQAGIIRDYTVQVDLDKLGQYEHVYVSATFP